MKSVLIDSSSYTYYRCTATAAWYKKTGAETPISLENAEFLAALERQYLSGLDKLVKLTGVPINQMIMVRDCPIDDIWRIKHYDKYKGSRRETKPTTWGPFIKHLNTVMADKFRAVLRVDNAEADDTIAVITQFLRYVDPRAQVVIVSGDTDYLQLLSPVASSSVSSASSASHGIQIYNPKGWVPLSGPVTDKVYAGDRCDGVPSIPLDAPYELVLRNRLLVDFNYIPRKLQDPILSAYCNATNTPFTPNHKPMPIQLGLVCINTELQAKKIICSRNLIMATVQKKGLEEIKKRTLLNCGDLIHHMDWNAKNGIRVFRISSDLFPKRAHPDVPEHTLDYAKPMLERIGRLSRHYRQRLTFHPDQFNVVGTPNEQAFTSTIRDLDWQAEVLDLMGQDQDSVMVVHGGGIYGNKEATKKRWIANFRRLPERVQRRLVLENCEKAFSIKDCLEVANELAIPVVFDTHHFDCYKKLHPTEHFEEPEYYMPHVLATWARRHIKPKFHVSEQCPTKQLGAHSDYIEQIPQYLLDIPKKYGVSIDIMIEAKEKEKAIAQLYLTYPELDPRIVKVAPAAPEAEPESDEELVFVVPTIKPKLKLRPRKH